MTQHIDTGIVVPYGVDAVGAPSVPPSFTVMLVEFVKVNV
jgi:hypothetical protein